MSEEIKRDCGSYVEILTEISRLVGEAKGSGWHAKRYAERERNPILARSFAVAESDNLYRAILEFHKLKDIVPERFIVRFERAAEKRDYGEMIAILETVALYVTAFCRRRLIA